MSDPRITVIIPTRARCDVLQKTLLTVTNQSYPKLEIIVSDNFSGDRTEDIVRSIKDPRVRYVNTGRRVSMAKNWEFALSHVDSGWVSIIGDDDGLMPAAIRRVAELIGETDVQAIRSSVCAYLWPGLLAKDHGRLAVPLQSGYEVRNSKVWLQKVLDGYEGYPQLPMLYYGGFVNIEVLQEIKKRSGSIYLSCIPDVYSAVSIASTIENYVYCYEPLCINGASRHSTGTSQFSSDPTRIASPAQMFVSEGNIPFHADLPLCTDGSYPPSLQAMVYESYLQSSCLRPVPPGNIHARMLRIILATSARKDSRIDDWGRLFAAKHGLDFATLSSEARYQKLWFGARAIPRRVSAGINSFSIGSPQLPLTDIYEASVAAGAVRSSRVGRVNNLVRLARRLMTPPDSGAVQQKHDTP
jgi:hypothetical protein